MVEIKEIRAIHDKGSKVGNGPTEKINTIINHFCFELDYNFRDKFNK